MPIDLSDVSPGGEGTAGKQAGTGNTRAQGVPELILAHLDARRAFTSKDVAEMSGLKLSQVEKVLKGLLGDEVVSRKLIKNTWYYHNEAKK
jgi:hypothetical protein